MNILVDLYNKEKKTIVVVTHDPSIAKYTNHTIHIKDGLIVKNGYKSALFLPQVPIEHHMNKNEYFENLCEKANINLNDCKDMTQTDVFASQGTIISE